MERHVLDGSDERVSPRIDALETRDPRQLFRTGVDVGHEEKSPFAETQQGVQHHVEMSDAFFQRRRHRVLNGDDEIAT